MWGSAFVAIKAGLDLYAFPPVLYAAVRYDVAGVIMLAYAWLVLDDPFPRTRGELAEVAIGAVFLIAGYHALLFVGETSEQVTSAAAAVIVSLSPVLTTAVARALLPDERLDPVGVVGLLLGLLGVVVLTGVLSKVLAGDAAGLLTAGVLAKLLVFGAALSFAFGSVLTRRVESDLAIESMEAWSMLGGAALMHVLSVALGESPAPMLAALTAPDPTAYGPVVLPAAAGAWAALAYLAVGASAVGFLIYFDLLDRLGPIEINLVSYVAPVFAALAGWFVLAETPTPTTGLGFLLIFLGFLLVKRRAIREEVGSLRDRRRGRTGTGDD